MTKDINHYVTKDGINNANFRQKLALISKNIFRRQNPLELPFEDISNFDAKNPIVGSLLKELDVGKKDLASELMKKAPRPRGLQITLRNRLNKLKDRPEPKYDNNHIFPSFSISPKLPPSFSQPPPLGLSPAPPFVPPPSGRFLELFQPPQPLPRPNSFIGIPPASSALSLSPSDYHLLLPSSKT